MNKVGSFALFKACCCCSKNENLWKVQINWNYCSILRKKQQAYDVPVFFNHFEWKINFSCPFQYHGKIAKLWDKYVLAKNNSYKGGDCPKSQSFYTTTTTTTNHGNLVHVTHNPDTNMTTTNVASPQTPKTLSTESSRVRIWNLWPLNIRVFFV